MAPIKNLGLIFKEVPDYAPVPGKHLAVEDQPIDLDQELDPFTVLVENLFASVDPYMRGQLRDGGEKSYTPAFAIGAPIRSMGLARILKSTHPDFQPDDLIVCNIPISQYSVNPLGENGSINPSARKVENPYNLPVLRVFLGALGLPGLTAYSSLYEIGKPKQGETIFISSAAGAVGQLVGQLAKLEGLRVVGSVGSQEKLDFILNELGFDGGFNYKTEDADEALKRLCPDGIDIYYENVGGKQLEAAITNMNQWGRIVASGMISDYNTPIPERYGIKNLFMVVSKRLTMRGFIVSDQEMGLKHAQDHQINVGRWLMEGKLKTKVDEIGTIEDSDHAFVGMLEGKNFGKALIRVKDCGIGLTPPATP